LAQIGEFSFILEKIDRDAGLTPSGRGEDGSQIFIAATVILIALTPVLFSLGKDLQYRLEGPSATDSETGPASTKSGSQT
jgi:CPA2 family monovalent cation:H+ antiporter-2